MRVPRGNDTKGRILELLKRNGAMTPEQLADQLDLTGTAIRQHLAALAKREWIEAGPTDAARGELGRGRPPMAWRLTNLAVGLFPDRHGELAASLLEHLREVIGESGVDRLIEARSRAQIEAYRKRVPENAPLSERLRVLARERTREGYMAEVQRDGERGFLLVEHHCPICAAAEVCAGLCRGELDVFRHLLGDGVSVERSSHLLSGADRCAYRVAVKDADSKSARSRASESATRRATKSIPSRTTKRAVNGSARPSTRRKPK